MIFKNQISEIIAINKMVKKSTIRFDRGSPQTNIFSFSSNDSKELNSIFEAYINRHPTKPYYNLIHQIQNIETLTSDWSIKKEQISISNGVLSSLFMLLPLLLNRKDKIIINDLCFEGIISLFKTLDFTSVSVDYENKAQLEKTIKKSKAKILILNSPENPSGKIYSEEFLIYLAFLTKKYDLQVISDEVNNQKIYPSYRFIAPCKYIPLKNLIVLNSFTKNYFLPGLRLGWLIANTSIVKKINNVYTISQVGINYSSQIITSYIIENYLNEINEYKKILLNKKLLMEKILKENGLYYMNPIQAGTVAFVNIQKDSEKFCNVLLEKYDIGAIPGSLFGIKWRNWTRLGFGSVSNTKMEKGIKTIAQLV